jgi:hypothetical protein
MLELCILSGPITTKGCEFNILPVYLVEPSDTVYKWLDEGWCFSQVLRFLSINPWFYNWNSVYEILIKKNPIKKKKKKKSTGRDEATVL